MNQRRYRTVFNLTRDERTALEAVSIETRLPLVQVVKRLLSLPHAQLVALMAERPVVPTHAGGKVNTYDNCPKCHDRIETGYGLAFGGFGAYQYCENEACGWYEKDRECPVCEDVHEPSCESVPPPQPSAKGE